MAMMRVGMGGMGGMGEVVPATTETPPTGLDRFAAGAKVWLSPSQVPAALSALWAQVRVAPGATLMDPGVLGFLLVPAAAIALVWGMQAARRRRARNPGRRLRRRNPRRRVARGRRRNPREVVGYAKLVKVRVPFHKSRQQWQYSGPGGSIRLFYSGGPGAVQLSPGYAMDVRTGAVYKDARLQNPKRRATKRGREWAVKRASATTGHSRKTLKRHAKSYTSRFAGKRSKSRGTHRVKNGRSWVSWGHSVPRGYTPGPGKKFQLGGRFGLVKSVYQDEDGTMWVQFRRAVDGTTGMSLGNFRQAAYIE